MKKVGSEKTTLLTDVKLYSNISVLYDLKPVFAVLHLDFI